MYRLGIAADLAGIPAYVGVTALLYGLLKPASRNLSLLAAMLSGVGIALGAVKTLDHIAPLILLSGAPYLSAFSVEQLQALSLAFLKMHDQTFTVSMIFFGGYCLLIGLLIVRSGFFPWIIGVMLAVGGAGYLIDCYATFVAPEFARSIYPATYMPGLVGEAFLALWLLLVGVNASKWRTMAVA